MEANGIGITVHFEHIDGLNNVLADSLSRLTSFCCADKECQADRNMKQSLILIDEAMEELRDQTGSPVSKAHLDEISLMAQKLSWTLMSTTIYPASGKHSEAQYPFKSEINWRNKPEKQSKKQPKKPKRLWPGSSIF